MLKSEMEALTELQQQEAVTANIAISVTVVALMILLMFWMWCKYKEYLARQRAEVVKARQRVKQTDVAFKHLKEDQSAWYKADLEKKEQEIQRLERENRNLKLRLDTIAKANTNC